MGLQQYASVADMMSDSDAARPRLKLVGDGVNCPTTRRPCERGCRTICLLPKPDGAGPPESAARCQSCGRETGGSSDPALHDGGCSNVNPAKYGVTPHRDRRSRYSAEQQACGQVVNISRELRALLVQRVLPGEAMEDTIRRLCGLPARTPRVK